MRYVSKRPKLDKHSKQTVEPDRIKGFYFQRIDDHEAAEEAKRVDNHEWSGFISPSAKLKWNMCMNDVYDRLMTREEKDQAGRHYTDIGIILHEGFEKKAKYVPGLLWPEKPRVPDHLLGWQLQSWPEVVGQNLVKGIRYKADSVINCDGEIGVFDLKNVFQATDKWTTFVKECLPRTEHLVQVCIYADDIEDQGYYDQRISWIGLGYLNVSNHQPKKFVQKVEFWYPFDEYLRHKTKTLVYYLAKHRRLALLGERRRCDYPGCALHGDW